MKYLHETTFAQTLIALANTLDQRQQEGLTQITDIEIPEMLRGAGTCINDLNIHNVCTDLLEGLENLGEPVGNQTMDSEESLEAVGQHLVQLRATLPESGFTPMMQDHLSVMLTGRIQRLELMLEALQRYLSR